MAQADELLRLRDEARLAAEREALEIVTAARRDVRRIVVQARRELLVLTAQLHAAVESVDQASIAPSDEAFEAPHRDLVDNASLGTTRELVMGARREVRSVLDEARAEIEALAAEVVATRVEPAALSAAPLPEPRIPTLDSILGADRLASRAASPGASAGASLESAHASGQPSWLPTIETSPIASLGVPSAAAPIHTDTAVPRVGLDGAPPPFADLSGTESANAADIPLSAFGETGPAAGNEPARVFLADLDERRQSPPAWLVVVLFAAAGVLVLAGTGWWLATRDTGGVLATPAPATTESAKPERAAPEPVAEVGPAAGAATASAATGAEPSSALVAVADAATAQPSVAIPKEDVGSSSAPRAVESTRAVAAPAPPGPQIPTPAPASSGPAGPPAAPPPPAADPDAATAAAATGNGRDDLVAAGQQWLDAYQRRDRDAMAASETENRSVSDERSVTERFPAWQVGVRRDLDQVELQLTGDTALLTGRMTERSGDSGTPSAQHVSRVSQIWVRRSGRWRLADVRIIAEARLNQAVR